MHSRVCAPQPLSPHALEPGSATREARAPQLEEVQGLQQRACVPQ